MADEAEIVDDDPARLPRYVARDQAEDGLSPGAVLASNQICFSMKTLVSISFGGMAA